MTTGTIKKVVADRGFGFIAAEDAKEYFFHRGGLDSSLDFDRLVGGERVTFEIEAEPQGPARQPGARRLTSRLADGPSSAGRRRPLGEHPERPRSAQPPARATPPGATHRQESRHRSHSLRLHVPAAPLRHRHVHAATWPRATGDREVVALHPPEQAAPRTRSRSITGSAGTSRPTTSAPRGRSSGCVDVVSIQHEYGIWGGEDGAHVLDFVRALDVPAVATLHTVLRTRRRASGRSSPSSSRRVDATVVMSRSAARPADAARTASTRPRRRHPARRAGPARWSTPVTIKPALGLEGRKVILSFGLLGPGKGYELAHRRAAGRRGARTRRCCTSSSARPTRTCVRREGEAYREALVARVARLGHRGPRAVRRSVRRAGRADALARGGRRLRHALPEPRPDRVRDAVVRDGRRPRHRVDAVRLRGGAARRRPRRPRAAGVPGGARRPRSTSSSPITRCGRAIGRRAYEHSRRMVWSAGRRRVSRACSTRVAGGADADRRRRGRRWRPSVPEPRAAPSDQPTPSRGPDRRRRDHAARDRVARRTRRTATASTTSPGRSRSTCSTRGRWAGRRSPSSAWRGLRFLAEPSTRERPVPQLPRRSTGRGSAASAPRTATGGRCSRSATRSRRRPIAAGRRAATALFERALPGGRGLAAPRAEASVVLGCARDLAPRRAAARPSTHRRCSPTGCTTRFRRRATPDWPWPERSLTYENALPPRALIVAGRIARLESRWSTRPARRSTGSSTPRPRPTGISRRSATAGGRAAASKSRFDQQPIEATALLLAAEAAHDGDRRRALSRRRWSAAYAWFLGAQRPRRSRSPIPRAARAATA